MSSSRTLFKLLMVLGVVMFLIGLMYPGQDAAWLNLQSTLSEGAVLPTFDNPFAPNQVAISNIPDANYLNTSHYVAVHGCTDAQYWECVKSNDGNVSYITLGTGGELVNSSLNVNMTDLSGGSVVSLTVTIWCRQNSTGTPVINNVHHDGGISRPVPSCQNTTDFHPIHVVINQIPQPWDIGSYNTGASGILLDTSVLGQIDVTYIQDDVILDAAAPTACGGDFFSSLGCQFGRFADGFVKLMQFGFNALSFIIVSVITLISFVSRVIFGIMTGLFAIFTVLFRLGAPAPVQYMIDIVLVSIIGWFMLTLVQIIRGSPEGI